MRDLRGRHRFSCSALLALASACSGRLATGGDPGLDDAGATPEAGFETREGGGPDVVMVTAEKACADYAEARCRLLERCSPAMLAGYYGSVASCLAREKLDCRPDRFGWTGVNETPADVEACARTMSALACDELTTGEKWWGCSPPPGRLTEGSPCALNAQCASGLCDRSALGCGVCQAQKPEGTRCAWSDECAADFACVQSRCVRRPGEGGACRESDDCAGSLACVRLPDGSSSCARPLGEGAPCTNDQGLKGPCDIDHFLICDPATLTCRRIRFVGEGERCGVDLSFCKGGTTCDYLDPMGSPCHPLIPDGSPCRFGVDDCWTPSECIDGVCKLRDFAGCR
jgi:hypothetical protein